MSEKQTSDSNAHAAAVAVELDWLSHVVQARLKHFFEASEQPFKFLDPPVQTSKSALGALIIENDLGVMARAVLVLAIAPHVNAAVLDPLFVKNTTTDRGFSQFGGIQSSAGAFLPTVETALFLVAGSDTSARIEAMRLFEPDHPLRSKAGIALEKTPSSQSPALEMSVHRIVALCEGQPPKPDFSPHFPAKLLTTALTWNDLVLPRALHDQLEHILAWQTNRDRILGDWGLARQFGRGYKALFYGPPGTGKTLTATLLGQRTGLDVYRIDLSMVVSKYVGETEKNLGLIFDMAVERDWILFFDEADALFGTRTATTSAHDRYANQEVSYLLQRIEECQSLVILATNLRSNIDDAFFRRFQIAICFSRPIAAERLRLWQNFLEKVPLADDVDLKTLSKSHELTGGAIGNVVRHAAVSAHRREAANITAADIDAAISAEMRKEGRTS